MNKKLVIIITILVVLFIYFLIPSKSVGNKFEAMVLPNNSNSQIVSTDNLKGLSLFADFSGSMKGFIDFSQMENSESVSNIFISTVGNFLDKIDTEYDVPISAKIGPTTYNKEKFIYMLRTGQGLNSSTTMLHNLFNDAVKSATDSTVSVVLSDMVLSYGKKEILMRKDTFYNANQLDALGTEIHAVMSTAKKKGLHVIILQYFSSFNGKYYYNYTENIKAPDVYKNKHMKDRPFYMAIIGKESSLKSIMENKCISKANNIYTTFDYSNNNFVATTYNIKEADSASVWNIGDPYNGDENKIGTLWSEYDYKGITTKVNITCKDFRVPEYIDGKDLQASFSTSSINSIDKITYDENKGLFFEVVFSEFSRLKNNEDIKIEIYKDINWGNASTVADDVDKDMSELEKKTWGFSTILDYIDKAYFKGSRTTQIKLGEFNFNIVKK